MALNIFEMTTKNENITNFSFERLFKRKKMEKYSHFSMARLKIT